MIAAGHKLNFGQNDVKINGHSMEYRVYAEDPSRNFLPSIGFLQKYREPNTTDPNKRVRIDTGVEEGSEISMYYDPMISKLITWGETREESIKILDRAFDEYVIRGVTHNVGFGKSILANKAYCDGDYSTAFIPTFYPEGFTGDHLSTEDMSLLSMVALQVKECSNDVMYTTIEGMREEPDCDFKIERTGSDSFKATNLTTGEETSHKMSDFKFEFNSLITFNLDGEERILQFDSVKNDGITHRFHHKGNNVAVITYSPTQYKYKKHMPEKVKIDYAKSIISPMPGAIVSVHVAPGDKVVAGQTLLIIEAMKMQNVIKAEIEGEID